MVHSFTNFFDMMTFVFENRASFVSVTRVVGSRGIVKYFVLLTK